MSQVSARVRRPVSIATRAEPKHLFGRPHMGYARKGMTLHLHRPNPMAHKSLARAIFGFGLGLGFGLLAAASAGCTDKGGAADAGAADAATSVSCYTDVQFAFFIVSKG